VENSYLNSLVTFNKQGNEIPIIFVHPVGGQIYWYRSLSTHFGNKRPFYSLMSLGLLIENYNFLTVEEMASVYVDFLLEKKKISSFILGGWSFGCDVAFEMAKKLNEIPFLLLIDPQIMRLNKKQIISHFLKEVLKNEFDIFISNTTDIDKLTSCSCEEIVTWLKDTLILADPNKKSQINHYVKAIRVYFYNMLAMGAYRKSGKVSKIFLMTAAAKDNKLYSFLNPATKNSWEEHCEIVVEKSLPADHFSILEGELAKMIVNIVSTKGH
jgi:thioesterase domain-containing protein